MKSSGFERNRKEFRLEHWQVVTVFMAAYDILAVNAAYFLALWLRFDCQYNAIPADYLLAYQRFAPVYSLFCVAVFIYLRLYKSIWRFASYSELIRVTLSTALTSLAQAAGATLTLRMVQGRSYGRMPISYYFFGTVLQFFLILGIRFSYRFVLLVQGRRDKQSTGEGVSRIMLIGAGNAGQMILRELHRAKEISGRVCCIIDDNPNKWNRFLDGVPIAGGRDTILQNVEKYHIDKILVAIPSSTDRQRRDILNICKEANCRMQIVPGVYQLINGEVSVRDLRDVELTDLLGRAQVQINNEDVLRLIKGTKVCAIPAAFVL